MLRLNFESIREYATAEERTAQLERILHDVVRGEVITQFTLIDELLTHELARKILGRHVTAPRRSKRFHAIKNVLAESRLSISCKLDLFRTLTKVPNDVASAISRLSRIRNHMAHQFFIDGSVKRFDYCGKNILSTDGLRLFQRDQHRVFEYLILR
jgi:hypothetical protein